MAMGKYTEAVSQYTRAIQLAPAFSFAAANKTLALYAAGQTDQAMREMRWVPAFLKSKTAFKVHFPHCADRRVVVLRDAGGTPSILC